MNKQRTIASLERDKAELQAALLALLLYHQGNRDPGFVEVSNRAYWALESCNLRTARNAYGAQLHKQATRRTVRP